VLNPASPVPLYHQLAELLSARIASGELAVGDKLPSEPELAREFQIGRPTVRQATDLLVRRHMIERRRGSGTYVQPKSPSVDLFSFAGTLSSFRSSGLSLDTSLLQRVARKAIAQDAEGNPFAGRDAYCFVRLSKLGAEPVLIEHLFLDTLVFADLHRVALAGASLSDVIRTRYFLEPTGGTQTFHVTSPPPSFRRALELGSDQPTLLVRRTLHFPTAPDALYAELYCRTDRVTFSQRLDPTG
jgi:GntR family transcriptional regulator